MRRTCMDYCCGHPSPDNTYHYHKYPICINSPWADEGNSHSPLLGWAFDGFPIYGPYVKAGVLAKDAAGDEGLNDFNLHTDAERGPHYQVTPGKFPYIIGGYWGTRQGLARRRSGAEGGHGGRRGGPDGGGPGGGGGGFGMPGGPGGGPPGRGPVAPGDRVADLWVAVLAEAVVPVVVAGGAVVARARRPILLQGRTGHYPFEDPQRRFSARNSFEECFYAEVLRDAQRNTERNWKHF